MYLNLHCDLDLENSNLIFTQSIPAYDTALSSKMWLQKDQQFSRYGRNSHFFFFFIKGALTVSPEGRPGISDVSPLSGISGLSFDFTLLFLVLFFCLVLLLFRSYLFFCLPVHLLNSVQKFFNIFR